MTTTNNITPLPWYSASTGNHQGLIISESNGANVAVTYDKDDAPYLARACNAYPKLVEALRECRDALNACQQYEDDRQGLHMEPPWSEIDNAEQLLTELGEAR